MSTWPFNKRKDNRGLKEVVRRLIPSLELHDPVVKFALFDFCLQIFGTQLAIVLNRDKNLKKLNLWRKGSASNG